MWNYIKLTKQSNEGSVCCNLYKIETRSIALDNGNPVKLRILLDASFQEVKRLFVLAFDNYDNGANKVERDIHRKYFLPRVDITKYIVLNNGRSFYDQPIGDQIQIYDKIRKMSTGQGDDCTITCLLDYQYFEDNYQLIAVDLSKHNELDADPRAIQQTEFYGTLNTKSDVCTILEKT